MLQGVRGDRRPCVPVLYLSGLTYHHTNFSSVSGCLQKIPSLTGYNFNTHPPIFIIFWLMSPANIQKLATGITSSTTSPVLNLCCSEAAVTETMRTVTTSKLVIQVGYINFAIFCQTKAQGCRICFLPAENYPP